MVRRQGAAALDVHHGPRPNRESPIPTCGYAQHGARRASGKARGTPSLGHHLRHAGEVVVDEHQLRHVARGIRACRHGHIAIGGLKRQRIVDPVACHSDGMTCLLQRQHELLLLLRFHAAEHAVAR